MESTKQAEAFFAELIELFLTYDLPFMVGGTYAFTAYTGIKRPTKDVDFFTPTNDYPKILQICSENGFQTELLDKSWIAKIHKNRMTADVIFAERNGTYNVDLTWLERATTGDVLGKKVKLMPVEDMIRSKSYIQYRNRYDGADVIHLILCQGKTLDWKYLYATMEQDWELLLSYFLLFSFIYPADRDKIPLPLFENLLQKAQKAYANPATSDHITRGLLLSSQYNVAIEKWGYKESSSYNV